MNNDAQTQTREWLYALAASKLTKGETHGDRPSLLEIEQWRQGAMQGARADQVLSYVAHDEQCFAQWRDLCQEQRWLDQFEAQQTLDDQPHLAKAPSEQKSGWLSGTIARIGTGFKPVWGGAIAAGLLALLVVPAMFRPADDSIAQTYLQQLGSAENLLGAEFPPVLGRLTKAIQPLDNSSVNVAKRQFQQGLAAVADKVDDSQDARWSDWRETLPEAVICDGVATGDCSAQAMRNQALGSWSLVTALACGNSQTDNNFWAQQAGVLNELVSEELAQGHFLAQRLQQPLPTGQQALCQLANGLLGQGG